NIAAEVAFIYEADRQDCLQAQRMRRPNRPVPATSGFITVEALLLTQADPSPGEQIIEMILRDFCSSPTYQEDEEDEPICESPPWFRFRKKRIRTYSRKRVPKKEPEHNVIAYEEEEDHLSCASDLSMQEDHTAPTTTVVCDLDASTSQKICENLLNLSEYFSLSNTSCNPNKGHTPSASIEIDLPIKANPTPPNPSGYREKKIKLSDINSSGEELENFEDDLVKMGFTFEASQCCDIKPQDSKVCDDWSDGDSFLENFNTEKMSLKDDEGDKKPNLITKFETQPLELKPQNPDICPQLILDDIPISEWQTPMDVPDESPAKEKTISQISAKKQPNKPTKANKSSAVESEFVGFRTASDKPIEITKEMECKGAMFIAQFTAEEEQSQTTDADFLQGIAFSQWEPLGLPEDVDLKTVSNKPIVSDELKSKDANLGNEIAKDAVNEVETSSNNIQSAKIPQIVGFRKTSYKFMEILEEMKLKGDKLIAEVEAGELHQSSLTGSQNCSSKEDQVPEVTEFLGFRTVPNKPIELSEVMRKESATLIAEVKAGEINIGNDIEDKLTDESEFFRTASNKPIVVSKEMQNKAAKLLADVQNEDFRPTNEIAANRAQQTSDAEFIGFRTASKKPIVISEEMKKRAAKLIAEVEEGENLPTCHSRDLQISERCLPNNNPTIATPDFFGFRTASNKCIEISEEMKLRAAKLMAEVEAVTPSPLTISENSKQNPIITITPKEKDKKCYSNNLDNDSGEDFKGFPIDDLYPIDSSGEDVYPRLSQPNKRLSDSSVVTPKHRRETTDGIPSSKRRRKRNSDASPHHKGQLGSRQLIKTTSCHGTLETPTQSQEIHASLTQLAGRSPLDQSTKTSVIARRNLLTLSKRRKQNSTPSSDQGDDINTPIKPKFAPMPVSASTPLADRNTNMAKDSSAARQNAEDMSPICMPPNKSRRLGLSRSRY
ncbi:hypothetical protein KR009_003514, partial [Drosophila setifemur]